MAAAFVSQSAANSGNTTVTSQVVTAPATITAGNLLIAYCCARVAGAGTWTSSGWRALGSGNVSGNPGTTLLVKMASGSEPGSYTFNWSGGSGYAAVGIANYSSAGLDGLAIDAAAQVTATPVVSSVTARQSNDVWEAWLGNFAVAPTSGPTGMTSRISTAFNNAVYMYDMTLSASGATGTGTFTLGSSNTNVTASVVLQSAPPVAGYTAWYDATQITGLTDGQIITTWPDLSGNGYDFTQSTGGNKPTYYSSTSGGLINGLPTVYFDGASSWMQSAGVSLPQPYTIYAVARASTAPTSQVDIIYMSSNVMGIQPGTPPKWFINGVTTLQSTAAVDTNAHVFTGLFNLTTSSAIGVDSTITTGLAGSATAGTPWYLGGPGTQYWFGPIGELIIYPSAITGANDTAVRNYLTNKWLGPTTPTGTATLALGPVTVTATGNNSTPTITGTATVALGPVALTSTSTSSGAGTATVALGPVTVTALALWTQPAFTIPLGPVTVASTSTAFAVTTIRLGPITTTVTSLPPAGGGELVRIHAVPGQGVSVS